MERDNAQQMINKEVSACKASTTLQEGNQSPKYSGHESAASGGPDKSAAGPKGVGATK